jgi:hypothetical protein
MGKETKRIHINITNWGTPEERKILAEPFIELFDKEQGDRRLTIVDKPSRSAVSITYDGEGKPVKDK